MPNFATIFAEILMKIPTLILGCTVLILFSISSQIARAVDFTWKGKTYRGVVIDEIEGDDVVLKARNGTVLTVPRKSLPWQIEGDVKKFEKAQEKKKAGLVVEKSKLPTNKDALERAWIHGSASGVTDEGFQVYSNDISLTTRKTRSGKQGADASNMRQGVPIYNGVVYVMGTTTGENTQFSRVLWRDGYHVERGRKIPLFRTQKPRIKLPLVAENRSWKNAEGRAMEASLKAVKEGKGQFVSPKGKIHVIDLDKLSAEDQKFVEEAVEVYEKEVRRLRKEYPWLELGESAKKK